MVPPPIEGESYGYVGYTMFQGLLGERWQVSKVLGYTESDKFKFFNIWKIGNETWNKACIIASSKEKFYKTIVNGVMVYHGLNYQASHEKIDNNSNYNWLPQIGYKISREKIFLIA